MAARKPCLRVGALSRREALQLLTEELARSLGDRVPDRLVVHVHRQSDGWHIAEAYYG